MNANLNLEKAFDKARFEFDKGRLEQVRNLIRTKDSQTSEIPPPPSALVLEALNKSQNKPLPSTFKSTEKRRIPDLTDAEIEEPLGPLLEYLEQTLEIFRKYLSESGTPRLRMKCPNL